MVGPGDNLRGGGDCPGLRHELGGVAAGGCGQGLRVMFLCPEFVECAGEAFGGAAGVDEDEGGAVGHDLLVDRPLHVRPHGLLLRQGGFPVHARGDAASRSGVGDATDALADEAGTDEGVVDRAVAERGVLRVLTVDDQRLDLRRFAEVRHHRADLHIPQLVRRRVDHGHRPVTAEEGRHGVHRIHRRRQADTLHGSPVVGDQRIEAFQAQRQVCATFRTGDSVDLVDDDGVHVHERAGGLRGEHEIEGLGRGDEHVRRGTQQFRPFGLRGVATADPHGDRGDVGAGGRSGACDPGQRDAQVALHIHTEGLERGDIEDTGPLACGLPCPVLHESGRGQP